MAEFHDFVNEKDGRLRICKLSAPWCGPCRVLGETMRNMDIDRLDNVLFSEVDIDADETAEIGVELGVRGVPVLVFYKDGVEVKRNTGNLSADALYNMIDEVR